MKSRLAIHFGILAVAGLLLTACASTDSNPANSTTNKADSYNQSQYKPQTPTPPIGSPPGKRY